MAKMMMGQIDHARKRIKEIKAEKRGAVPKRPVLLGGNDVLSAIRDGDISISAGRLRQAFDAFLDRVVAPNLIKQSGRYRDGVYQDDTYSITDTAPKSIEDALAAIVYSVENNAEIARWEVETDEYLRITEILDARSAVVEDAIVLGDQHAALQALQEFAAFKPEDFKADTL